MFPFIWALEISPTSTTSFSQQHHPTTEPQQLSNSPTTWLTPHSLQQAKVRVRVRVMLRPMASYFFASLQCGSFSDLYAMCAVWISGDTNNTRDQFLPLLGPVQVKSWRLLAFGIWSRGVWWIVSCVSKGRIVKVKVKLRPTVCRPVCLWIKHPSGATTKFLLLLDSCGFCWCGALSPTRGRVCCLQLLLALASAVILGSESRGTRNHILLPQIRDFHFRRLLRLAGLRWRYLTRSPHGMGPIASMALLITSRHRPRRKYSFSVAVQLLLSCTFAEPLPSNGSTCHNIKSLVLLGDVERRSLE
jgi:hypothetical protein